MVDRVQVDVKFVLHSPTNSTNVLICAQLVTTVTPRLRFVHNALHRVPCVHQLPSVPVVMLPTSSTKIGVRKHVPPATLKINQVTSVCCVVVVSTYSIVWIVLPTAPSGMDSMMLNVPA